MALRPADGQRPSPSRRQIDLGRCQRPASQPTSSARSRVVERSRSSRWRQCQPAPVRGAGSGPVSRAPPRRATDTRTARRLVEILCFAPCGSSVSVTRDIAPLRTRWQPRGRRPDRRAPQHRNSAGYRPGSPCRPKPGPAPVRAHQEALQSRWRSQEYRSGTFIGPRRPAWARPLTCWIKIRARAGRRHVRIVPQQADGYEVVVDGGCRRTPAPRRSRTFSTAGRRAAPRHGGADPRRRRRRRHSCADSFAA